MKVPDFDNIVKDVSGTEEGKRFLNALYHLCCVENTSLVFNGTNINVEGTLHNEAMRLVYLLIRQHVPVEVLRDIEFRTVEKPRSQEPEEQEHNYERDTEFGRHTRTIRRQRQRGT